MMTKYGIDFDAEAIVSNQKRIINQIYKLLPLREEGGDWQNPLETLIVEIAGMGKILIDYQTPLFSLLCKLEGMKYLLSEEDFQLFRRTVFESLSLLSQVREQCQD